MRNSVNMTDPGFENSAWPAIGFRAPGNNGASHMAGNRIVLICPYMGPLPVWLPVFLASCRSNPEVDWLIVTDAEFSFPEKHSPDNVRWMHSDIEQIAKRATTKLGFETRLNWDHARKLCDLKPAYGLLFEERMRGYDFWGHCDLDIVWGRIRHFITDDILRQNDIISSRMGKIAGHFTLYRNTDAINGIIRDVPGFRDVAGQPDRHVAFDEIQFTEYLRSRLGFTRRIAERLRGKRTPRVYWDRILHSPGKEQKSVRESANRVYQWVRGATFAPDGREIMYVHFHILKRTIRHYDLAWGGQPTRIMISEQRISAMDS